MKVTLDLATICTSFFIGCEMQNMKISQPISQPKDYGVAANFADQLAARFGSYKFSHVPPKPELVHLCGGGKKGGGEGKKEQTRGGEERKREEGKRERGKRRWGEEKIEEMRWGCAENLTWNLGFTSQVGQRRWGMYPKAAEKNHQ